MIKKLKRKFILTATLSTAVVLLIIATALNIINYQHITTQSDDIIKVISDNNGTFPMMPDRFVPSQKKSGISPEAPFATRFFSVYVDADNNCISADTSKILLTTNNQAISYAETVLDKNKTKGFIDDYRFIVTKKNYGSLIVFIDCQKEISMIENMLRSSIIIYLCSIAGVFILTIFFSRKVIAPVAESYEKQKKFITNASHELKTPLSVISANTEVIEMENEPSKWTNSINNQVSRLTVLVNNLVSLTRMDEKEQNIIKTDFSISDAVAEIASNYCIAFENADKHLSINIDKNISYTGDEKAIRELVSILLDNALKYALQGSSVTLSLVKKGRKVYLSTINMALNLKKENYDRIFERFYRLDSSRNSDLGGSGIGLSIAKSIVDLHKGRITADSEDGRNLKITAIL